MSLELEASSSSEIFQRFDTYDFASDEEFQAGLASILSSNPRTTNETILMAKTFYYSKKFEPIDYNEYIARKQAARPLTDEEIDRALLSQDLSASLGPRPDTSTTSSTNLIPPSSQSQSQAQPAASSDAQLPYPATFAEIVELIKSGKPIPGIRTIPDKTADGEMSKSQVQPRAKPWDQPDAVKPVSFF